MKMANIDAVFDFMFTGMKNKNGVRCFRGGGGGKILGITHTYAG